MAAIAAVIGYALYAGHLVYLGMVPILIGLVFVEVILTHNQMLFVAKHLALRSRVHGDVAASVSPSKIAP
ncbi:hypothetical protein [Haloferax sulfurifontis]|uniref:Uncharacterized protein n=2 Tax=Haloferax sulfurifontis TaxID=255616 RepID=M0I0J4_9EURY|nr:hypothetical protein [Haloferax sulfurifontis]ELZ90236.1 hypothetical protein C441_13190 [Haloferax sulfurifontis ATCC BAA-897]GGC52513.1 hypothetical protein GCM10007209_12720 [Haloferax sulfurifontis]